jgi:hypothetical protein
VTLTRSSRVRARPRPLPPRSPWVQTDRNRDWPEAGAVLGRESDREPGRRKRPRTRFRRGQVGWSLNAMIIGLNPAGIFAVPSRTNALIIGL